MSDEHAKSPRWDRCSTCHYPWPCREALLVQLAALRQGLRNVSSMDEEGERCWCPGDWPASASQHWKPCQVARALLAPPAADQQQSEDAEPWCTEDQHIVMPSGEACVCGDNRKDLML